MRTIFIVLVYLSGGVRDHCLLRRGKEVEIGTSAQRRRVHQAGTELVKVHHCHEVIARKLDIGVKMK